jgi:hypothetical protein
LQCRIDFLESEDPRITSSADQAMEFEKHYLSQLQVLSKKFEKNKPQNNTSGSNLAEAKAQINVKLPTLELLSFSGQYTEWTAFHDTFSSLIEKNDQLSGVQKFHYLKSCLKGEAGKVIESLTISNENYKFA